MYQILKLEGPDMCTCTGQEQQTHGYNTVRVSMAGPPLYGVLIKVMSSFYILLQLTGHAVRVSEAILSELS